MSDDGKTVSTARVVELEMQLVSCRAAKARVAELEAGLRGMLLWHAEHGPTASRSGEAWRAGTCDCRDCLAARRLLGEGT